MWNIYLCSEAFPAKIRRDRCKVACLEPSCLIAFLGNPHEKRRQGKPKWHIKSALAHDNIE